MAALDRSWTRQGCAATLVLTSQWPLVPGIQHPARPSDALTTVGLPVKLLQAKQPLCNGQSAIATSTSRKMHCQQMSCANQRHGHVLMSSVQGGAQVTKTSGLECAKVQLHPVRCSSFHQLIDWINRPTHVMPANVRIPAGQTCSEDPKQMVQSTRVAQVTERRNS